MIIIDLLLMLVVAYTVGFLYYGLYRNITARFQRRFGPPVWQSFIDSIKFFFKEDSISHGWMFYLGPVIMMTGAIMTLFFIPFFTTGGESFQGLSQYGNAFVILYLLVLGPLGNALGVGAGGSPFGAMGITRGLTRLFAMELPFYIAAIAISSLSGSVDIVTIATSQSTWNAFAYPLLFIAALISFIGMMGQSPFDLPGAPVEVYSGPASEFSGKFLALLMSQSAIFTFAKLVLMVHLFMGGASGFVELLAKTFLLFIVVISFGAVYGRFKTPQAVDFLLKVPTTIAVVGLILATWS